MSENYLPSKDNLSILAGELYFKPDGAARYRSLGHIDLFSWTPTVDVEEVFAATSGVRQKIDEIITQISVEISMTLKEATVQNMAYAMQGDVVPLLQAAQTGVTSTITDLKPGELIELAGLKAANVVLTADTQTLVHGVDYMLIPESGVITALKAYDQVELTYDLPEIATADNQRVIEVLANHRGISGSFHIVGKNQRGKRYSFKDFKATLRPSGAVTLLSDGSGLQQIELVGAGIENSETPATPWGKLIEIVK